MAYQIVILHQNLPDMGYERVGDWSLLVTKYMDNRDLDGEARWTNIWQERQRTSHGYYVNIVTVTTSITWMTASVRLLNVKS